MNGQAAEARAQAAQAWRREVLDELDLYKRYGEAPATTVQAWIQNIEQDIEYKRRELFADIVERNRLTALLRTLQNGDAQ